LAADIRFGSVMMRGCVSYIISLRLIKQIS